MQRIEENALIVSCDFCGTDWDGVSPVIEGHRGSIICLECMKATPDGMQSGREPFTWVLGRREPIPASVERWNHANHAQTYACKSCVHQAAEVFDKDPDI